MLLLLADFNLYPIAAMNHNYECTAFSEFYGSLWRTFEPEHGLENPLDLQLASDRSEGGFGDCSSNFKIG